MTDREYAVALADALRDTLQAMRYNTEDAPAWKEAMAKGHAVLANGVRYIDPPEPHREVPSK